MLFSKIMFKREPFNPAMFCTEDFGDPSCLKERKGYTKVWKDLGDIRKLFTAIISRWGVNFEKVTEGRLETYFRLVTCDHLSQDQMGEVV